jgi:hypothetical protein
LTQWIYVCTLMRGVCDRSPIGVHPFMNTYRIYEDLRLTLGEEAAKSLAHTLGPMFEEASNAVTKAEFHELCASIEAHNAVVDAGFARLIDAQSRTESKVSELAEGQARLTDAQSRTEAKVSDLAVALGSLTNTVERLSIRTDTVIGRTFELQFRDRLSSYLGRFLRRSKLLRNDEVLDAIESVLESQECDEVLRVDAIASGLVDGVPSHVVVEVSSTGDTDDVVRAERRAAILRKAGMAAIPVVACEAISRETALFAQARGVRVWCNGTMLGAAG